MNLSLEDQPKLVQYMTVDSRFVNGSNNVFSLDFTLESNTHPQGLSKVCGVKVVEFYVTQVGGNDSNLNTDIAKYIDIVCDEIPTPAQILDERHSSILTRVPLERHFSGGNNNILIRDKQWKPFQRKLNYFNPISIKKLNFRLYEMQDDGDYLALNPACTWHMILEIHTIDVKAKPVDKNAQILIALEKLTKKIENLNTNVKKLPDKPVVEQKKYPFSVLVAIFGALVATFVFWVNRGNTGVPQVGMSPYGLA
jgi:hypothetical protein